jgi:hypothetical protein
MYAAKAAGNNIALGEPATEVAEESSNGSP